MFRVGDHYYELAAKPKPPFPPKKGTPTKKGAPVVPPKGRPGSMPPKKGC